MTSRWQIEQVIDLSYLDGADWSAGVFGGNGNGFVLVASMDQVEAAEEFAGLSERTVGNEPFALADADTGGSGDGMQRGGSDVLSPSVQLVRQSLKWRTTLPSTRPASAR